ncbi:MAG: diguanylate cyclase, partial [Rhizobiales bacterium]|nr:diguanylate cyclase [Hyphomicrobiales bacterium]
PEEKVVARIVAQHREGAGSWERRLPDGRWVLKKERRTADGGIVGIRTDITALKAMLTELAEANTRANEATAEAQRQNAALSEREAHIRFLAHHDDLTGLPNRIQFRQQIEEALGDAARGMRSSLLLYLDLDRFKDVNDALGHPIGDALLRMVAERLRQVAPEDALVARLGSDEFAMLSRSTGDPAEVERLSHSLLDRLGAPYSIHGHAVTISASIGVAVAAGNEPGVDELLKQADVALQEAKARGRNNYCRFAPEMEAELKNFHLGLQGSLARSDQAFFAHATALSSAAQPKPPAIGRVSSVKSPPVLVPTGQQVVADNGRTVATGDKDKAGLTLASKQTTTTTFEPAPNDPPVKAAANPDLTQELTDLKEAIHRTDVKLERVGFGAMKDAGIGIEP